MRKNLIFRVWFSFTVVLAIVYAAGLLLIHFGLFPILTLQYRRSIESAYSYMRSLNLTDLRYLIQDEDFDEDLQIDGFRYMLMD